MTPADRRRQIEILIEFARFTPGVGFEPGIVVHPAPERDPFANIDRRKQEQRMLQEIKRDRPPLPEIAPLPRVACPTCGMSFGTDHAVDRHQKRAHR